MELCGNTWNGGLVPYQLRGSTKKRGARPGNEAYKYNSTTNQCWQGDRACLSKKLLYNRYNMAGIGVTMEGAQPNPTRGHTRFVFVQKKEVLVPVSRC